VPSRKEVRPVSVLVRALPDAIEGYDHDGVYSIVAGQTGAAIVPTHDSAEVVFVGPRDKNGNRPRAKLQLTDNTTGALLTVPRAALDEVQRTGGVKVTWQSDNGIDRQAVGFVDGLLWAESRQSSRNLLTAVVADRFAIQVITDDLPSDEARRFALAVKRDVLARLAIDWPKR
jgi:hypothetical protein